MIEILTNTIQIIYIDGNIDIYENPTIMKEWELLCGL